MVMLWIEPINEIKLVALVVLLAAALLTGPVAGLALGWRHGRLGRLAGSALGLGVGVLSVMVVAVMMYEADQAEMVLIGPAAFAEAGDLAPVAIGGEVRYALPVYGPLYGRMTLTWALLYPIRVGAAILCTWFATTLLWSLGRMGARFVVRSRQAENSPFLAGYWPSSLSLLLPRPRFPAVIQEMTQLAPRPPGLLGFNETALRSATWAIRV